MVEAPYKHSSYNPFLVIWSDKLKINMKSKKRKIQILDAFEVVGYQNSKPVNFKIMLGRLSKIFTFCQPAKGFK